MLDRRPNANPSPAPPPVQPPPDRVGEDLWWRVGLVTIGSMLRLFLRIRLRGLHNIPQRGGAIIAPNHVSVLDPPIIALGSSARGRTIRFLAAAEFFESRRHIVAWGLRRFRQIPVRRGMADWGALQQIAAVIRSGAVAGIFPEGRMGDGSALQRGHRGLARVALAAGVPIVPVGIWGTQERWPRSGLRWSRPVRSKVSVVFGPPIHWSGDPRSRRDVTELTDRVMREIGELLARARADVGT